MFNTVPRYIDTTNFDKTCYGKGTTVKVQTLTAFRTRETILLKEHQQSTRFDSNYQEMYNIIGDTNLVIDEEGYLVAKEKTLFDLRGRVEYVGNDPYVGFWLQPKLNPKLFGYKKYGKDLYLRPILITTGNKVNSAGDILGIAGFQLMSRNNVHHNGLKPLFVRGVKRAKETI